MQKLFIVLLFIASINLLSCSDTTGRRKQAATVTHNVSGEQLQGAWYYKGIDADIEISIPGMQEYFRSVLQQQLETELQGATVIYRGDHTMFLIHKKDTVTGRYKIEHKELVHYDLNARTNIMNYASAHLEDSLLKISVSEDQFHKMLSTAGKEFQIPEEVRNIIKMKGLTYTFEKK